MHWDKGMENEIKDCHYVSDKACHTCGGFVRYKYNKSCIKCRIQTVRKSVSKNPETRKRKDAERHAKIKEKDNARAREWVKNNPERKKEADKRYYKENYAKVIATVRKYDAKKLRATPTWLTIEDYKRIALIYEEAIYLTQQTGIKHHVDHDLPLQGKNICGLHIPENLKIMPATDNIKKSNHYNP